MSLAELGFAPEIQALLDEGVISQEYAENNRRLAVLVGDFIVNHLAIDPVVIALFQANDRAHFIEGINQAAGLESRWIRYLADISAQRPADRESDTPPKSE